MSEHGAATGALPLNMLYFARALRDVGMPVGPGATLDGMQAIEAAGFTSRGDFRAALHAVFVKKREHTVLFDQVFDTFWKRRGLLDKMIALMSPSATTEAQQKSRLPAPAASRMRSIRARRRPRPAKKNCISTRGSRCRRPKYCSVRISLR